MPMVAGQRNRLFQPIYDTITLAAAAVAGDFFAVPFGGAIGAGVKNYSHTNLVQGGRLERDTSFTLTGIAMFVRAPGGARATQADIRALNEGSFDLQLGTVSFLKVPIANIPNAGAELELVSNIAAAATEYQLNKGVSAFGNKFILDQPLQILEQETINAHIQDFVVAAPVTVTCVLFGTMERPVR